MIASLAVALLAMSGTPATSLGPLFSGESVAAVRRSLGAGTPVSTCRPDPKLKPGDCPLELDYADGANVLKVGFGGAGDGILTMQVDLAAPQGKLAPARVPAGAFATWKWNGRPIDRLPTAAVTGWTGTTAKPHKDCYVEFKGPAQSTGALLVASFACASGTAHVGTFQTGFVDP